MFKSLTHYNLQGINTTGITVTGSGMLFIRTAYSGSVVIDNENEILVNTGYDNSYQFIYLFKNKCKIYTNHSSYSIQVTIGLFN